MTPESATTDRPAVVDAWSSIDDETLAAAFDLGDPQLVAALAVPPCSVVLSVGLGDGAVLRTLTARRCRVWAVEAEPEAARAAAPWCEGVLLGDVDTVELDSRLAGERCDAILFPDGVEHLRDPTRALRRVRACLAPGGRVVLVTPPAVDGSSEHVDHPSLHDQLRQAGFRLLDQIRLAQPLARAGTPDQQVLIAAAAVDPHVEIMPTLAGAAMERWRRLQHRYQQLEAHAGDLDSELDRQRVANRALHAALEEARGWHRRSAESVATGAEALRREVSERQRLERQLEAVTQELDQRRVEQRFLRDDLVVKDAYLATLRDGHARHQETVRQLELAQHEQHAQHQQLAQEHHAELAQREHEHAAQRQAWESRVQAVSDRLDVATAERDAAADHARTLETVNAALRGEIAAMREESHRVHTAVAETMAQPRYVLADRINGWARRFGIIHGPLKRALSRRRD